MAHIINASPAPRGNLLSRIAHHIADLATLLTESNWRVREAERLQQMSDLQLAQRGLRREDIGRHVFRDLFYI